MGSEVAAYLASVGGGGAGIWRQTYGGDCGLGSGAAVVCCVAVEAMEGTDATIERAGALMRGARDARMRMAFWRGR